MMLVAGPASPTSTASFLGWRSWLIETGTGLAHPKIGAPVMREDRGQDDRTERIDVLEGIESQPPGAFRRVVATPERDDAVAHLVADDRRDEGTEEDQRLDVQHVAADREH